MGPSDVSLDPQEYDYTCVEVDKSKVRYVSFDKFHEALCGPLGEYLPSGSLYKLGISIKAVHVTAILKMLDKNGREEYTYHAKVFSNLLGNPKALMDIHDKALVKICLQLEGYLNRPQLPFSNHIKGCALLCLFYDRLKNQTKFNKYIIRLTHLGRYRESEFRAIMCKFARVAGLDRVANEMENAFLNDMIALKELQNFYPYLNSKNVILQQYHSLEKDHHVRRDINYTPPSGRLELVQLVYRMIQLNGVVDLAIFLKISLDAFNKAATHIIFNDSYCFNHLRFYCALILLLPTVDARKQAMMKLSDSIQKITKLNDGKYWATKALRTLATLCVSLYTDEDKLNILNILNSIANNLHIRLNKQSEMSAELRDDIEEAVCTLSDKHHAWVEAQAKSKKNDSFIKWAYYRAIKTKQTKPLEEVMALLNRDEVDSDDIELLEEVSKEDLKTFDKDKKDTLFSQLEKIFRSQVKVNKPDFGWLWSISSVKSNVLKHLRKWELSSYADKIFQLAMDAVSSVPNHRKSTSDDVFDSETASEDSPIARTADLHYVSCWLRLLIEKCYDELSQDEKIKLRHTIKQCYQQWNSGYFHQNLLMLFRKDPKLAELSEEEIKPLIILVMGNDDGMSDKNVMNQLTNLLNLLSTGAQSEMIQNSISILHCTDEIEDDAFCKYEDSYPFRRLACLTAATANLKLKALGKKTLTDLSIVKLRFNKIYKRHEIHFRLPDDLFQFACLAFNDFDKNDIEKQRKIEAKQLAIFKILTSDEKALKRVRHCMSIGMIKFHTRQLLVDCINHMLEATKNILNNAPEKSTKIAFINHTLHLIYQIYPWHFQIHYLNKFVKYGFLTKIIKLKPILNTLENKIACIPPELKGTLHEDLLKLLPEYKSTEHINLQATHLQDLFQPKLSSTLNQKVF